MRLGLHQRLDASDNSTEANGMRANYPSSPKKQVLTSTSILFLVVFALVWYIYTSGSTPFLAIFNVGSRIYSGIAARLFTPLAFDPSILRAFGSSSGIVIRGYSRIILYITQFFIALGVLNLILRIRKTGFSPEFIGMTAGSVVAVVASLVLPYFASSLNATRIYLFAMLFLSPFFVLGVEATARLVFKLFNRRNPTYHLSIKKMQTYTALLISIVLIVYLLANTGFFYEISGDVPSSVSLSKGRMETSNLTEVKVWLRSMVVSQQDVLSATWLSENMNSTYQIYADLISKDHVLRSYGGQFPDYPVLSDNTSIHDLAYIYLGQLNVQDGIITGKTNQLWNTTVISGLLQKSNQIFSTDATAIYISIPGH